VHAKVCIVIMSRNIKTILWVNGSLMFTYVVFSERVDLENKKAVQKLLGLFLQAFYMKMKTNRPGRHFLLTCLHISVYKLWFLQQKWEPNMPKPKPLNRVLTEILSAKGTVLVEI